MTATEDVLEPGPGLGGKVVFRSNRDGQWDLYVKDMATGAVTRLTNDAAEENAPEWSPDGTRVAYHKATNALGTGSDLFVINADGTGETRLTFNFNSFEPTWSPDGLELAYQDRSDGDWEIMVRRISDGVTRQLTNNTSQDIEPTWHGTTIAFVRTTTVSSSLLTMSSVDGGGVAVRGADVRSPAFAPDGTRLTFVRPQAGSVWNVEILTLATSGLLVVESDGARNATPTFSPDGSHIMMAKNLMDPDLATDVYDLWVVPADGSGPSVLVEGSAGDDQRPSWR
jgi:Tol biopolymer transport system component